MWGFGYYSPEKPHQKFARVNLGRKYNVPQTVDGKGVEAIVVGWAEGPNEDSQFVLVYINQKIHVSACDITKPEYKILLKTISGKPVNSNVYLCSPIYLTNERMIKSPTAVYPLNCLNCGQPACCLFQTVECTGCKQPRVRV